MSIRPPSNRPRISFRTGDLVLCRYASYPYWPATISNTFPPDVLDAHCCWMETTEGRFHFYWCLFCNEEKGGWVREDRIVKYHPDLALRTLVPRNHSWYSEQRIALRAALKRYRNLYSAALQPRAHPAPQDLVHSFNRHMNGDNDSDSEVLEIPRQSHPSTIKAEENMSEEASHHRGVKRERTERTLNTSTHDATHLSNRSGFENRARADSHNKSHQNHDMATISFYVPTVPDDIGVRSPGPSLYNTRTVDANGLKEMIKELEKQEQAFRHSLKDSDEQSQIFDMAQERLRSKYQGIFQDLQREQRRALSDKGRLIDVLHNILQAQVQIPDLRALRAGSVIKELRTKLSSFPSITSLCDEIIQLWQGLVNDYVAEIATE